MDYFLIRAGKKQGPIHGRKLKQLAKEGKIRPDDLIGPVDGGKTMRADQAKGLLPAREVEFEQVETELEGDESPDPAVEWEVLVNGQADNLLVTDQRLIELVQGGRLQPNIMVRHLDNGEWQQAGTVEGLFYAGPGQSYSNQPGPPLSAVLISKLGSFFGLGVMLFVGWKALSILGCSSLLITDRATIGQEAAIEAAKLSGRSDIAANAYQGAPLVIKVLEGKLASAGVADTQKTRGVIFELKDSWRTSTRLYDGIEAEVLKSNGVSESVLSDVRLSSQEALKALEAFSRERELSRREDLLSKYWSVSDDAKNSLEDAAEDVMDHW